jgi:hypothetical protein
MISFIDDPDPGYALFRYLTANEYAWDLEVNRKLQQLLVVLQRLGISSEYTQYA